MVVVKYLLILSLTPFVLSNGTDIREDELKEMEYREGISVESKYSLPSVKIAGSDDSNEVVPSSLQRVLNFYNTEILMTHWPKFKHKISKDCRKDVDGYIEGLRKTENWALKMDDASGRYSTGWFWGNHYWVGSQSLCEHIEPKSKNIIVSAQNRSRVVRTTSVQKIEPSSPSNAQVGYQKGPLVYSSAPPFSVSFFLLKLHLNSSFTTEERILSMGLCLPDVCKDEDVKTIMEETSAASAKVSVEVLAVKSEHNRFNVWQDTTFWTLCIVSAVMACFLAAGTLLDYYLEHLKNKKVATITQRFSVPSLRSNNGKSGIYVVNTNNSNDGNNNGNLAALEVNASASTDPRESVTRLILRELLLSFSVKSNLKIICDQSVGSDTIPVLHGLKSISMAWVILGHTCIVLFKYSDNMEYRKVIQKQFFFQTITNGAFSVDTFFFVSGLLVSFLYFRTNAKGKLDPLSKGNNCIAGLLHFLGLIFYRFARLTAPYLFALGLTEVTMKWFYYNSVFEPPTSDHLNCPNYWWRNLLYINTLYPMKEMCMLWSWYLSDDTQFYTVGAIILIVATSHFKSAVSLLVIFGASSWMTTGYIAYSNSHMPGADDPLALFDKIYDKPWTRLGPYLVGMCVGWLLFKKDCRIPMSKLTVTMGWTGSIGLLLALVYGLYEVNLSPVVGAAYSSLSHSAWALGLAWIVIACVTGYGDNREYVKVVQKQLFFQTLTSSPFSVDTFFFVSGLLVSFLYFRTNAKGKLDPLSIGNNFVAGLLHFLGMVFYRFFRLTAPYLFAMGLTEVTYRYLHYNSVFEPYLRDDINCSKYWWRNILYINIYFPEKEMCMVWSWYLSNDTQFYTIGAIILIIATRYFKTASVFLVIIGASSWIVTGMVAYSNSHIPGMDDPLALFDQIYSKPWTRIGPYFVGMCVGWLLFKKDCRIQMSKLTVMMGWTTSFGIILALVYGLYEANLSPVLGAVYSSMSHSAWALSLAWIVIACVTGYGGMVNSILSTPILYPFSRVTYCAYLVHPLIVGGMAMTLDSPLHLGASLTLIIFLGQTAAAYILALVLSLAFEAPFVSMLKIGTKVVAHKKNISSSKA